MTCPEFENRVLDFLEGRLPAGERDAVGKHLAGCAGCRNFAGQLKQLDAALTQTVKAPVLSASFATKLRGRIATTTVLSASEIAERKRQFQAEYEAGLARLRPFALPSRRWLESFGYAAAIGTLGLLASQFLPQVMDASDASGFNISGRGILPLLIVSGLFAAIGLIAAFPGQFGKLREMVFTR